MRKQKQKPAQFDPSKCTITAGAAPAVSLASWLEARVGHEIHASWKSEDGDYGPVCLFDDTEAKEDPRNTPDAFGVPYDAPYSGRTNWISSEDALVLIRHFGLARSEA